MIAHLRMLTYGFCLAIAFMSGIAALTILAAIVTHKLSDPEAWTAVVFFAVVGGFSWMAGRAVK
jgi:Na+/phosphate symporter